MTKCKWLLYQKPSKENDFLAGHLEILSNSLAQWTGRNLIDAALSQREAAQRIYFADFAIVSHNTAVDPVFNYANRTALNLFEMELVGIYRPTFAAFRRTYKPGTTCNAAVPSERKGVH